MGFQTSVHLYVRLLRIADSEKVYGRFLKTTKQMLQNKNSNIVFSLLLILQYM